MDEELFAALVERVDVLEDEKAAYAIIIGDLIYHTCGGADKITKMRERVCSAIERHFFDDTSGHDRAHRVLAAAEAMFEGAPSKPKPDL